MATPEEQKRIGLANDPPTASTIAGDLAATNALPTNEPQAGLARGAATEATAAQAEQPSRGSRIATQLLDLQAQLRGQRRPTTITRERERDFKLREEAGKRDAARLDMIEKATAHSRITESLQQDVLKGKLDSQYDDFSSAFGDTYNESLTLEGQEASITKFYADGKERGYTKELLDASVALVQSNDRNIEANALGGLEIQAGRAIQFYQDMFPAKFKKIQEGGITIAEIAAINDQLPDHMLDENGRPVDLRLDNKSQFPMLVRALQKGFQIAGIDSTALTKERELEAIKGGSAIDAVGARIGKLNTGDWEPESLQRFAESVQNDPNKVGNYEELVPIKTKDGRPDPKTVHSIRDKFGDDSKTFSEAQTQFKSFMNILQTGPGSSGAGDVATTYSFIKYLDQNSTVMPAELKLGQSIGNLAQMTLNQFRQAYSGVRLDNTQRAGMEMVVEAIFRVHLQDQFRRETSLTKWANHPDIRMAPELIVDKDLMDPNMRKAMEALADQPDMTTAELPEGFDFDLGALLESGKQ